MRFGGGLYSGGLILRGRGLIIGILRYSLVFSMQTDPAHLQLLTCISRLSSFAGLQNFWSFSILWDVWLIFGIIATADIMTRDYLTPHNTTHLVSWFFQFSGAGGFLGLWYSWFFWFSGFSGFSGSPGSAGSGGSLVPLVLLVLLVLWFFLFWWFSSSSGCGGSSSSHGSYGCFQIKFVPFQ